jgi:NAD(P)-dependent dehydrogenase (short-subunit alcohol dehydrogenase family)
MGILNGYTVLVTGAAQGIGRGIALAAAAAGAGVLVTALDYDDADKVAGEIVTRGHRGAAIACDVTKRSEVETAVAKAIAEFGKLDAFIHNATSAYSGHPTPLEEVTDEDWGDQVAVALRPIFFCAHVALPALRRTGGSLVVLSSSSGIEGTTAIPAYSAVKGAQRGLVKSLAREWGPLGVRVNALAPSAMTPAVAGFLERQPDMRAWMMTRASLRRLGDAENDIGPAINFLIGPDSAFVTGQTLLVSGGSLMI